MADPASQQLPTQVTRPSAVYSPRARIASAVDEQGGIAPSSSSQKSRWEEIMGDDDLRASRDTVTSASSDAPTLVGSKFKLDDSEEIEAEFAQRVQFLITLTTGLLRFGSPTHRIESQLSAVAEHIRLHVQFTVMPDLVIMSFPNTVQFVKEPQGLDLGKLHEVRKVYSDVLHAKLEETSIPDATAALEKVLASGPIRSKNELRLLSVTSMFILCILAFHGSTVDALISGACALVVSWAQQSVAEHNPLYGSVFGICIGVPIAFLARGLSSIPSQIFCYDAIASTSIISVLPGYAILCSALELANKNFRCGSLRLVYAVIVTLFVGFSLTLGSDLYLLIDEGARHRRELATQDLETMVELHGQLLPDNSTLLPFSGSFSFSNITAPDVLEVFEGCHREANWPWYLQEIPWWSLFFLVPIFSLLSSLSNMQPLLSKEMVLMVVISCASFAANTAANKYIFLRSDIVSAIGGFVVGILGNLASRVFRVTAFSVMVTGVLFLVPSGLSAAGGLAQNYRGTGEDQYMNGLQIGVNMVKVSIGITIGLICSDSLIYSFGQKKQGGWFNL